MKKSILIAVTTCFTLGIISWGGVGHKTIATIAENHLTPNAKAAVKALLGAESLADVASWADEARNTPEFKYTSTWHYLEFTLGMNYQDFSKKVLSMDSNNVYGAILKSEADIKSNKTTRQQKIEALKFLVHFIGDCHQPMHLSKAEDKGGNMVQVQFNGKGSNLHGLWDSGLINREGRSFDQMAKDYDTATPAEIKRWQNDVPMQWVFESYQFASKIYVDVEKNNNKLDDVYYKENIPVVHQRIEMAGIRLAGVLNELFKTGSPQISADVKVVNQPINLASNDVSKHIGDYVITSGKVVSTRLIESNGMTLLNIGTESTKEDFTVVIQSADRSKFGQPEIDLKGKTITVTGKVVDYKGKAEIFVTDTKQIVIVP